MGAPRAGAPTTRNGCETAKRRRSNVVPRGGDEGSQLVDMRGYRLAGGCDGRQRWRHRLVQPRMWQVHRCTRDLTDNDAGPPALIGALRCPLTQLFLAPT
jgi:hypothetical protein